VAARVERKHETRNWSDAISATPECMEYSFCPSAAGRRGRSQRKCGAPANRWETLAVGSSIEHVAFTDDQSVGVAVPVQLEMEKAFPR
jgi:hypothetical protein